MEMADQAFYLIYQEASDEECLLTIQPYKDEQALAEAINQLQAKEIDEYTIIYGKKLKASLRLAVELSDWDEE